MTELKIYESKRALSHTIGIDNMIFHLDPDPSKPDFNP